MGHSFRDELVKEIRHRFSVLAILIAVLLVVLLTGLVFFIQGYQVNADMETINRNYNLVAKRSQDVLRRLNQQTIPAYLQKQEDERALYQQFYEQSARLGAQASLLIMNDQLQPAFQSDSMLKQISLNYVQTVIKRHRSKEEFFKITSGDNDQHFLLCFSKIAAVGKAQYSILLLNGTAFNSTNLKYGSGFVLADNYDNVFATNSTRFIRPGLAKVDSKKFKSHFYLGDDVFLMRKEQLAENIFVYAFLRSFPPAILIVFGILSVTALLGFLIWQANRAAKTIGNKMNAAITELVRETSKIRDGQQKQITITSNDEFQYLAASINAMVAQQDALATEQLHLQQQTNQYELKMLEAQFNPHFLYNTLKNIRITSKFDPALTEKLILSLNRVLRYSIDHGDEPTTLTADLDVLEDFMAVNQVRFDKLQYEVQMDPELSEMAVPRLFILPLVENALKYGMRTRSDLKIRITCRRESLQTRIIVADNGGGFPLDMLGRDWHQLKSESHHGLVNSFRRVYMMYPTVKMRLDQAKGGGAKVMFLIGGQEDV